MSLQRGCQFCGRRMRGVTPGAMTILLDGQPLDVAIVLCAEHGVEIRRVLDNLRQRSAVAQQARAVDVTASMAPIRGGAQTEAFPKVAIAFDQEAHGRWLAPVDARLPVPLERPRSRRNLATLRSAWRGESPQ